MGAPTGRQALPAVAAVLALAGCGLAPVSLPAPTTEPGLDATPEVALLHLTAEDEVAADGLELRLEDPDGTFQRTISILPGERVIAQLGLGQGTYTLAEAHGACRMDVELEAGAEIDVIVALPGPGKTACALAAGGRHAPGAAGHPLFGALFASFPAAGAPDDLRLRVRSLDTPPNPAPAPVEDEVDRPGMFAIYDLPQGVYEAQVTGGSIVLGSAEFVVGIDADAEPHIDIVPASMGPSDNQANGPARSRR